MDRLTADAHLVPELKKPIDEPSGPKPLAERRRVVRERLDVLRGEMLAAEADNSRLANEAHALWMDKPVEWDFDFDE